MREKLKDVKTGDKLIVVNTGENAGKTRFELEVKYVTRDRIFTEENFVLGCLSTSQRERVKKFIGWGRDEPILDKLEYNSFKVESVLVSETN